MKQFIQLAHVAVAQRRFASRRTVRVLITQIMIVALCCGPVLSLDLAVKNSANTKPVSPSARRGPAPTRKPKPVFAAHVQTASILPGQTATQLPDGRTLLIGGEIDNQAVDAIAISDGRSGVPVPLRGKLHHARAWHSATMLPDGHVLVLGGIGKNGAVLKSAEIFDPESQSFALLSVPEVVAQAYHSATLLTNGQVFITGGSGETLLWDFKTKIFRPMPAKLAAARQKHKATLLFDGNLLIEGGVDANGNQITSSELYNAASESFNFTTISNAQMDQSAPFLAGSLPENSAADVPVDTFVALRFSKRLRVETLTAHSITLTGSEGTLEAKVVPAESGRLAFVTPKLPLLPGMTYTVSVADAIDESGATIAPASITFTTKKSSEPTDSAPDGEEWNPDWTNFSGNWTRKHEDSQWRSLPLLQADEGVTALAGQVLTLDGKPLDKTTLRIGDKAVQTDNTGRFLLTQLPAGHQVMVIDGRSANRGQKVYGIFKVGVEITAGTTNALGYTIWMPRLDTKNVVTLSSPTKAAVKVTNPSIPGLELHLPDSTVIRDMDGQAVTQLSITPIPTNQPPFPLPPGIDVPVYFTIQPGGSQIIPPRAQLIYPNFIGSKPGTRIDFWNYDPTGKGWYVYGQGTVTPNGRQIVPDPGVVLYEFSGAMVGSPGMGPGSGPEDCCSDGDPVNLGTGLLVVEKMDFILPDTIPISLKRTYRQNDTRSRPFGIGATHPYEILLLGTINPYTYQDLILPDGRRIRFDRISTGTGFSDAVYENLTVPGPFYKARINHTGNGPMPWQLRLKDGTIMLFPDSMTATEPRFAGLQRVQDRHGNVLNISRDGNARLNKITTAHNRWLEFTYDTNNRIIQAKDNIGRTVDYTYDAGGRLWKVKDANNGITEYTYDSSHRMLTIKDPRGIVYLTNEYDPTSGRVIKQTLPDDTPANSADNPTYVFAYTTDSGGRIVQTDVTDPRGYKRRVTFGPHGYVLSDTFAFGTSEQKTVSFEREGGTNLLRAAIDPLGRRTEYNYDPSGNLTSIIELAGTASAVTTAMTYEPTFGRLASITDVELDRTTTYAYDATGVTITDPLNRQTILRYNGRGQLISTTDPLQQTTQFVYAGGDLVQVIDPLNRAVSMHTDGAGRLLRLSDSLGNRTLYEYDPLNQVKKIIESSGGVTEMTYDDNGNLLSLKDARNQTTSFTYDNMDRVLSRTDSLQGVTSTQTLEYDRKGNPTKVVDRRGKVTTLEYDALDRPTFAGFGATAGPTYESTINYTYDPYNRLTQVVDSVSGTISINYDDLARTISETSPQGTVGLSLDQGGRVIGKTVTGQAAISYAYDKANRLLNITQGSSSVHFTYDDADRRESVTLPNGVVVQAGYDAASQLTRLTYSQGATALGDLTYTYDKSGRRTSVGGSLARTGLPQTLSSASYNAANRVTQSGAATLTYDANGNLTSDGANTYTWDARNRLVGISGAVSASFQYDSFGRRVRTTINGATKEYLYDGMNVVQEIVGGSPTANMLTAAIDETFSRTESAGTQSVIADGSGSTLALLDSAGATQTDYTFEPFGNTSVSGAASGNSSQYTGRENDGTGLYYYRARYYSPKLQRFISEDPIGFAGGDTNLYAYVGNDPVNYTDASGLWPTPDTVADGFFIGMDIYNIATGSRKDLPMNLAMLGVDLIAAAVPGVTGAGQGLKYMYSGSKRATQAQMHSRSYQTYTKTHPTTGEVYTGRTSGYGTPLENIARRDRNHHRNDEGFGPAVLDKSSCNPDAIRGREQQMIEKHRNQGNAADQINGVGPTNKNRTRYLDAGRKAFGLP